jgi:hypothetical protein
VLFDQNILLKENVMLKENFSYRNCRCKTRLHDASDRGFGCVLIPNESIRAGKSIIPP